MPGYFFDIYGRNYQWDNLNNLIEVVVFINMVRVSPLQPLFLLLMKLFDSFRARAVKAIPSFS